MLPRKIVVVAGQDSQTFLQGLITQDINKANVITKELQNNALYSALLTNKGRYNFDFFIVKITNEMYLIDIHELLVEEFLNLVNFYKLLAKVRVQVLPTLKVFALNNNANHLNSNLENYETLLNKHLINKDKEDSKTNDFQLVFQDARLPALGYRVITTSTAMPQSLKLDDYTVLRYKNGVLEYPELVREKSIPIQCGFDELNALCYNKGCYLGQEFTHSAKHKMVIRKRVLPYKLPTVSSKMQVGSKITALLEGNQVEVGYILSSFKNYAFLMLNTEYIKAKLYYNNLELIPLIPNWFKN